MRTYRQLFAIAEFRRLFAVRVATMASVVLGGLGLGVVMFDATGSPVLTALAMFGGPLVTLATSSFLLASSDLLRPRTAIVAVTATAGVTDLGQLIPGLAWGWRFALLAAGYVVVAATSGTVIALLADIVPPDGFVLARSTMNMLVGGIQVIGNGVGALLLLHVAPTGLFWISSTAAFAAALLARFGLADHPPRASGKVVARTRAVNRVLLGSRTLRPVLLTMWVPNGLIVGCEALFVPYAHARAGLLFAAAAAGMLLGDLLMGRFVPPPRRDRLVEPLRLLLAIPYLGFFLVPAPFWASLLGFLASVGYSASLPLQERIVRLTDPTHRGQAFGLAQTGMMVGQSIGAVGAGAVAQWVGRGTAGVGLTMGVFAVLSLATTLSLTPGLRRSREGASPHPAAEPLADRSV
ncbi:Integral membrane protein [Nostocoides japonicum T1-X7]|uniref:Integral membrane protein n=1 Tax=Nostocoides japonicum T1-X7 TaxID=1194083 RepID=A0A077LTD0_9MICO|nr:MFS transporter [Tetrasphaera japonica]CCH76698.1 Integral membrane protein [Tetrasphaera japonica T1-X7]